MDPVEADNVIGALRSAQAAVKAGISSGRAQCYDTGWTIWRDFCDRLGLDTFLKESTDKIEKLQIFAARIRSGELAPKGHSIKSRSVEDYLRGVAQTFTGMGLRDPRLSPHEDSIDIRIRRMLAGWRKEDPPPQRVKPVPLQVIQNLAFIAKHSPDESVRATVDMIILAFFFLLRPGEYTDNSKESESEPFRLEDIQLFVDGRRLDIMTCSHSELMQATFGSLTFTTQKNGVRGEVIGLAKSGHDYICPVLALVRRVIYLRSKNAKGSVPLARLFDEPSRGVSARMITKELRNAVTALGPSLGFTADDVSARCLRAAGANALLLSGIDGDIIRLIGRWKSDEMLRYLHVQAAPLMADYSRRMLESSTYNLLPNQDVPIN
mmetsp:Transcript_3269/g.7387  ORF Transcript_3269/g.7387 Transcript_3269/m.7387 type:complete len:379 (+) Transcript_3269:461-1597(+)